MGKYSHNAETSQEQFVAALQQWDYSCLLTQFRTENRFPLFLELL